MSWSSRDLDWFVINIHRDILQGLVPVLPIIFWLLPMDSRWAGLPWDSQLPIRPWNSCGNCSWSSVIAVPLVSNVFWENIIPAHPLSAVIWQCRVVVHVLPPVCRDFALRSMLCLAICSINAFMFTTLEKCLWQAHGISGKSREH